MRYIKRNGDGEIVAISAVPEPGYEEEQGGFGGEVAGFIASSRSDAELAASDLEFGRVIDDLLEVLTAKGIINFTDLPEEAQAKFLKRSKLRVKSRKSLDLLGDDGLI